MPAVWPHRAPPGSPPPAGVPSVCAAAAGAGLVSAGLSHTRRSCSVPIGPPRAVLVTRSPPGATVTLSGFARMLTNGRACPPSCQWVQTEPLFAFTLSASRPEGPGRGDFVLASEVRGSSTGALVFQVTKKMRKCTTREKRWFLLRWSQITVSSAHPGESSLEKSQSRSSVGFPESAGDRGSCPLPWALLRRPTQ